MSDAVYMDFEEPSSHRPKHREPAGGKKKGKKKGKSDDKALIPRLPDRPAPSTGDEVLRGISNKARSVAHLRTLGFSFQEIADEMGLDSAEEARRIHHSVIAATARPEEIEMHRATALARAELLFKQSIQMATADYLVTDDGERVPNDKKLAWHQQAAADAMNIATLTGAKAPTKVEFSPGEAELERIVSTILVRSGHEEIVDADVIELEAIPDPHREPDEWAGEEITG